MTAQTHDLDRERVRVGLLDGAARETHRDVYAPRRLRLMTGDPLSIGAVTRSIRDLGELLDRAGSGQEREWLVLRLRNRLDALDALDGRGGHVG